MRGRRCDEAVDEGHATPKYTTLSNNHPVMQQTSSTSIPSASVLAQEPRKGP